MADRTQFVRIGKKIVNLDQITSVELKTPEIASVNLSDGTILHFTGDDAVVAHATCAGVWEPETAEVR